LKLLDLFSGIGGFSLGLERAGFETIAFCEIEDYPRKVLAKHWPGVPIAGDIRKLSYNRETQELIDDGKIIYRGAIDAICGGYPCQPHSFSGDRKASEDSRDLWPEYSRLISEIHPRFVLPENVLGVLSSENGQFFRGVLRDLARLGYDAEWFNIPSAAVGAPHLRARIWMVAYPNETQFKGGSISGRIQTEYTNACYSRRGQDKPGVVRTLDGISSQMDRLGCLGNAVYPEIPELLGRATMSYEADIK